MRKASAAGIAPFLAILPLLATLLAFSCSSAPKGPVYEIRNQAVRLAAQANGLYASGDYVNALALYRQALSAALSCDYEEGIVESRNAIGRIYAVNGLADDAAAELEKARAMAERLGNKDLVALNLALRADLALQGGGGAPAALELLQKALALSPSDDALTAVLGSLGQAYKKASDYDKAAEALRRAAAINGSLKRNAELGASLYLLASVELRAGKIADADRDIRAALAADKEAENAYGICSDYYGWSKVSAAEGKDQDALWYLGKSLDIALVKNLVPEAERALSDLIALEDRLGMAEAAAGHRRTLAGVQAIGAPKLQTAPGTGKDAP